MTSSVGERGAAAELEVGLLISSLGLAKGGMETCARHLASGLAERGHRVTVVAGRRPGSHPETLPVRSIRVPCVPANLRIWHPVARRWPGCPLKVQSLSFAGVSQLHPGVRRLVERAHVTVTFFEIETAKFSAWRQRLGRPNVSYFPGGIDWAWLRRDRSVVRVAPSRLIVNRYRDVIGFNIDGVLSAGVPGQWLEVPYSVRADVRVIIFVGRLEANKGLFELLSIFERLASKFPDMKFRILGDGPLRGTVESTVARAGLTERVACLGAVPLGQVGRELGGADLFVLPSHHESFCLAALEAQAVGLPVVAADIPGVREALGELGWFVPLGDEEAWIRTISALIPDRAERESMSRAGRQRARRFTWRRAVEHLEHYLRLAIERFPA